MTPLFKKFIDETHTFGDILSNDRLREPQRGGPWKEADFPLSY